MNANERTERIELFLNMANAFGTARETIDNLFDLIDKYDLPKHIDRDFVLDCLIEYYKQFEVYEKCAVLYKYKLNDKRKKRITASKITKEDLYSLKMLGFAISDSVKTAALLK